MLTRFFLVLCLYGCSYYQEDYKINQTSSGLNIITDDIAVFNAKSRTAYEIEAIAEQKNLNTAEVSCVVHLYLVDWLIKQDFLEQAQISLNLFFRQEGCAASQPYADLLQAQLYIKNRNYSKGYETLRAYAHGKLQPYKSYAQLLINRYIEPKSIIQGFTGDLGFINDAERVDKAQKSGNSYNQFVVIYEPPLDIIFSEGCIDAFEKQNTIKILRFLSLEEIKREKPLLNSPEIAIIGYRIAPESLPDCEREIFYVATESQVQFTKKNVFLPDLFDAELGTLYQEHTGLYPQLIFYDDKNERLLNHAYLKDCQAILLHESSFQKELNKVLGLQYRKKYFSELLKEKITYIQQPNLLPHQILFLLEPSLARLVYPYLLSWGQDKTLFIASSKSFSGDKQLDKTLNGVWHLNYEQMLMTDKEAQYAHAKDIFELVKRAPIFENDHDYSYEGSLGCYRKQGDVFVREAIPYKVKLR